METRDKILYESFKLFIRRDYGSVAIADIIQCTDVSQDEFSRHFKSKEDLFNQLAEAYVLAPLEQLKDYFKTLNGTPEEKLNTVFYSYIYIIDGMVDLLENDTKSYGYYLIYFAAQQLVENFEHRLSKIYEEMIDAVKVIIRDLAGGKPNVDESAIDFWASQVISLCEGIWIMWILNKKRDYKQAYMEACENIKSMLAKL